MYKLFEKIRKPISYITLIAMIAIALVVAIGQSAAAGTFYIATFSFAIVIGVCLFLYIIAGARGKAFPVLVALVIVMFIFLLNPFLNATVFEQIGWAFDNNAALGLAEICYLLMVLGGVAVLVLYLLEAIFGIKLSLIIQIILLALVAVALTYFFLSFIGVIISMANDRGSRWYEMFSPLLPVAGYIFVCVNFSLLEEKTKNI